MVLEHEICKSYLVAIPKGWTCLPLSSQVPLLFLYSSWYFVSLGIGGGIVRWTLFIVVRWAIVALDIIIHQHHPGGRRICVQALLPEATGGAGSSQMPANHWPCG